MHRQISFEPLERREMLSVNPTITDVSISSTQWDSDFIDELEDEYLGYGGYSVTANSDPAPWDNVDQIKITFDQAVDIQASDLSVSGVNTIAYDFSGFEWDSASNVATWTLSQSLAKDKIFLDLDADGIDPVDDGYGGTLDGDGDGYGGDDFELRFDVLPGDADQGGDVDGVGGDYYQMHNNIGNVTTDAAYNVYEDIDGDGTVEASDRDVAYTNDGDTLPSGDPEGVGNDAPTTDGFADVNVNEDAANESLLIQPRFEDAETGDYDLTYTIVSNSNPSLFDSVTADIYYVTLDYADDANGSADIVVRATDAGGLFVDAVLHVVVAAVNDAPVISDFSKVYLGKNVWLLSGTVTDVDDDVEGFIVEFGGIEAVSGETWSVAADGTFAMPIYILPSEYGWVSAKTKDDDNAWSNTAWLLLI
jgi:hypothetical protein